MSKIKPAEMGWHEFFLNIADAVSRKSKDPNSKVGAVIVGQQQNVLSVGYNGFPIDVLDREDRWERPDKYDFVCHAEQNAILLAARHGTRLGESTLYVNKKLICKSCCKSIIQAGIHSVVVPEEGKLSDRWDEDAEVVHTMFDEAGVELNMVSRS